MNKKGVRHLYIIATFKHSKKIEIALADLKNNGLNNSEILALPLDNRVNSLKLFDSKDQSDRESLFDLAAILRMIVMLLGSIYGFVLKWGPIIWALNWITHWYDHWSCHQIFLYKEKTKRQY